MRAFVLGCILGGCSFKLQPGTGEPIPPDGSGDGSSCAWMPLHFDACNGVDPGDAIELELAGTYVYDTDVRTFTDPNGALIAHVSEDRPELVIMRLDAFSVGVPSRLRAIGVKPLLIASWSTIEISGGVDVSSTMAGRGAGSDAVACAVAQAGEADVGGSSGGGGGGFGAAGGAGGNGDSNMDAGGDGSSTGGLGAAAPTAPIGVRGGCKGADGGTGGGGTRGLGGHGGGAIQLSAAETITISGAITAGGEGGMGVDRDGGGGGGGSGGYIGLDAPIVTVSGVLASNGGAGSGGGDDGNVGGNGGDGSRSGAAAVGGLGGLPGGTAGGNGGHRGAPAGATVIEFNTGAGGGGGGSVGGVFVRATTWTTNGVISPVETLL